MVNGIDILSCSRKAVMAETYRINEVCCCLGSLKCGTIFIGVLYTILSLLTVSASFSYKPSLAVDYPEATQGQISYEFGNFGIYTLITLCKVSSVLWLIVNLALLYGTLHEDADFVAPWVAWHLVLFFLQVIVAVWCGDIVRNYMDAHAVELGSVIIAVIISEAVLIYFIIVVNSFYHKLKKTSQGYERVKLTAAI